MELKLNHERISYWLKCGAQPTDTVRNLIRKSDQHNVGTDAGIAANKAAGSEASSETGN